MITIQHIMYRLNSLITAIAPITWGSTYIVTSQWLPEGYPITMAMLRALPAGVLMMLLIRQWPTVKQLYTSFILGALNFTVFWICLFTSAYRLPGGVAATLGATQPLIIIGIGALFFQHKASIHSTLCALTGVLGVALLVIKSHITLDVVGVCAAVCSAASMAMGTLLSKRWRNDVPLLTFTSWQLTAGGVLLLPLSLFFEPNFPSLNMTHVLSLAWLGIIGAALSYVLWFRGISLLGSFEVSILGFLSPLAAILLGWLFLEQSLNIFQVTGIVIIIISILSINNRGVKNNANLRSH